MKSRKFLLSESEMPRQWYNIIADMPNKPMPPLNPGTREPMMPQELSPLFPQALIEQETTAERFVDIPDEMAITKNEQYGVTDLKPWEKTIYEKKVAGTAPAAAPAAE